MLVKFYSRIAEGVWKTKKYCSEGNMLNSHKAIDHSHDQPARHRQPSAIPPPWGIVLLARRRRRREKLQMKIIPGRKSRGTSSIRSGVCGARAIAIPSSLISSTDWVNGRPRGRFCHQEHEYRRELSLPPCHPALCNKSTLEN